MNPEPFDPVDLPTPEPLGGLVPHDPPAPPPPIEPHEAADIITRAWCGWLETDRRKASPHATVWASSWRACDRRMVLDMTVPDLQLPVTTEVLAKFRRGNDRERDLLVDLLRVGRLAVPAFNVEEQQQRFEVKDRQGRPVITGKVDGRVRFEGEKRSAPLEIKSWSQNLVERIETFEDVFTNPWTRGGGYQLLSYLFGANEPYGFLLLDRSGIPRLVVVELNDANYARMEEFLSKAEQATRHARESTLPDFILDAAECHRCPFFGTACHPPVEGEGAQVLTDPVLEADLEEWWAMRDAGKRWASLDESIKKRLRGVEQGVAGHFSVTGRWGAHTRVVVPPELKKQFTVTDPQGRFTLEVVRL